MYWSTIVPLLLTLGLSNYYGPIELPFNLWDACMCEVMHSCVTLMMCPLTLTLRLSLILELACVCAHSWGLFWLLPTAVDALSPLSPPPPPLLLPSSSNFGPVLLMGSANSE